MLTQTVTITQNSNPNIIIGRRSTYETQQVIFDVSWLVQTYGEGTAELLIKRPKDASAYPVVATLDGNTLTWTVSETDTQDKGHGECEIYWYVNGGLAKSCICGITILRDIGDTTETAPDPYQTWVDELARLGAETLANAQAAQQSANNAAQSASEADNSAAAALESEENAHDSENAAKASEQAAAASEQGAEQSATAARQSATEAAQSASAAESSAANAQESADNASASAGRAEQAAASIEGDTERAEAAAQTAQGAATSAQGSASVASTKATEAAGSAATAEQAASTATQEAADASASATAAAGSASSASASATAAGNAQTAAETAQGKAEDAQEAAETAAQSIEDSAAQITQNAEDILDLKSALSDLSDIIIVPGIQKTISDLSTGKYYNVTSANSLEEIDNNNSIYIKIDVSAYRGKTVKIELNTLVNGSRYTGFADSNNHVSYSRNQPNLNSYATLNAITGLYEIILDITDDYFFFSYNKSVSTVNISIESIQKVVTAETMESAILSGLSNPKFAHFSFDDVRFCMEDITSNSATYTSIFDNPFFSKLKQVHDDYGTFFSLFLFSENMANYSDKYKTEFAENAYWLKFGLHANQTTGDYSETTAEQAAADYNAFVTQIYRITGTYNCIDKCPRLSSFHGNKASCTAMRDANCGIVGLLAAYDTRDSYYLNSGDSAYVYNHGRLYDPETRLTFYHTYKSIEAQNPITVTFPYILSAEGNNGSEYLIMMAHEYAMYDSNYQIVDTYIGRLDLVSDWANKHGYLWQYPMNRILH